MNEIELGDRVLFTIAGEVQEGTVYHTTPNFVWASDDPEVGTGYLLARNTVISLTRTGGTA